jgi:hypothetical protein
LVLSVWAIAWVAVESAAAADVANPVALFASVGAEATLDVAGKNRDAT